MVLSVTNKRTIVKERTGFTGPQVLSVPLAVALKHVSPESGVPHLRVPQATCNYVDIANHMRPGPSAIFQKPLCRVVPGDRRNDQLKIELGQAAQPVE